MMNTTPPADQNQFAHANSTSPSPWERIFRIIRWSTYALALVTLLLLLHKAPPPPVETSPQAARDIAGFTVNRWAYGYAFTPNPLFDPGWNEEENPWVIGRKPFGKIAIANSDAGASAYTDVAIDQAWRAVRELLRS